MRVANVWRSLVVVRAIKVNCVYIALNCLPSSLGVHRKAVYASQDVHGLAPLHVMGPCRLLLLSYPLVEQR